ncbi:MAG: hypothetical protein CM15mP59_5160 [Flavobacteriaceae bacterium]|nr:MAG: hypothetical protein CM15mP59_5160 [Flavobacteriaceae bacterium]
MGIAVPYLQKLQKEGESGRRTINQITRWLTIAICVVQAPAYLYGLGALVFLIPHSFLEKALLSLYFSYHISNRNHICDVAG